MSQPSQLTPTDQDALVKQIGIGLMRAAPQEWQQIKTEYRAAGRYYELTAEIVDAEGDGQAWTASHDVAMLFAKLRAGMHSEDGGTWFNARYQIDRPSRYNLEFDRSEPSWRTPPPLQAYRDELRFFPRADDDVPEWLMHRLSGLRPDAPARRFRIARIFDGRGPSGRPSVNRPPVEDDEQATLLSYLDRAPLVLPERGFDIDRLSAEPGKTVPVAFHCDGTWIWPAAVNYYLRHYGLPPEPALVEHARANDFVPPEIDEATASEAAATITGPRPPGPPAPPPRQEQGRPQPPMPGAERGDRASASEVEHPPSPPAGLPIPIPEVEAPQAPRPGGIGAAFGNTNRPADPPPAPPVAPEPPTAGETTQAPRTDDPPEIVLDRLRDRLDELGVPQEAYRIGEPAQDTWYLEAVDEGWQVGWFDDDLSAPMLFDEPGDAAAFLLGKLMLTETPRDVGGRHSGPEEHELPGLSEPARDADALRPGGLPGDRDLGGELPGDPEATRGPALGLRGPAEPASDFRPSFDRHDGQDDLEPAMSSASFAAPLPGDDPEPSFGGRSLDPESFEPRSFDPPPFEPQSLDMFEPSAFPEDRFADDSFADDSFAEDTFVEDSFVEDSFVENTVQREPFGMDRGGVNGHGPGGRSPADTAAHAATRDDEDEARETLFEPRQRRTRFEGDQFDGDRFGAGKPDDDRFDDTGRFDDLDLPEHGDDRAGELTGHAAEAGEFEDVGDLRDPVDADEPAERGRERSRFERDEPRFGSFAEFDVSGHGGDGRAGAENGHGSDNGYGSENGREPVRDSSRENGHSLPARSERSASPLATRDALPEVPPAREASAPAATPVATVGAPAKDGEEAAAPPQWPIQPLNGEPPLTLFRHKQLSHLPAGTEIDRFGDQRGNLTYDSGTPFEHRSLVPEWVNRPYRVYQLQKPIEVLVGVAIPWFGQPGGGTAYLLPDAISEHIARGELVQVEVDSDEHP